MKNILAHVIFLAWGSISAQHTSKNWSAKLETQKVFIENLGQWDSKNNVPTTEVLYATDVAQSQILFTKKGITYRLQGIELERGERNEKLKETKKIKKQGSVSHNDWEEHERDGGIKKGDVDFVQMEWTNPNPNVELIAEDMVTHYYTYNVDNKPVGPAKAFRKLVYKNLYVNIDVEYIFHPENGIEYSFILHPGADASQIEMKYYDVNRIWLDETNHLHLKTIYGNIVEHTPKSFYAASADTKIASKFVRHGNTVNFSLADYDKTKTLIIDPWVQTPAFNTQWDCIWECERDAGGNVYVLGGVLPEQVLKYNSNGALLWTYTTPYDTTSWLGTFATDNIGNTYVTQGSLAAIQKINASGNMVWSSPNTGAFTGSTEFWSIAFNCDQTKLVIGGTGGYLPPIPYVYEMNVGNWNITDTIRVTGGALFPTQEVRCITQCQNGSYYFLTHDSIGYLAQNFGFCASPLQEKKYFKNDYHLGYKCENFRLNNTGICAMKSFGNFVFINRGSRIDKIDFQTGAIVDSAVIATGAFTAQPNNFVENSGIDIDVNGNIFAGSRNRVIQFDQNLNQTAVFTTTSSMNIYDVHVSSNGNIIAAGSSGTASSGARQGYVESWAANSAAPVSVACCDAGICQPSAICISDLPVTLSAYTPGGYWHGPGITDTVNGVLDPSIAGVGIHYVSYTLGCGSDSVPVIVHPCAQLLVCVTVNDSIQVSGGVGPYIWYERDTVLNCSNCLAGCTFPPNCAFTDYEWSQFTSGDNAKPIKFPVLITDAALNQITLQDSSSVAPCVTCILSLTATATAAACDSAGTATVTVVGGNGMNSFLWSNNDTTSTITNLSPGSYSVTVTSDTCHAIASTYVSDSLELEISSTPETCPGTNGTAAVNTSGLAGLFTYLWSNAAGTSTITNLPQGSYSVTVTGSGCSASASINVAFETLHTNITTSVLEVCFGDSTLICAPGGSVSYLWNTGAVSQCIYASAAGDYFVTATDANNCEKLSDTLHINFFPQNTPAITLVGNTLYSSSAWATYQWLYNGSIISGANADAYNAQQNGNYSLAVTDSNGCKAFSPIVPVIVNEVTELENEYISVERIAGNEAKWKLNVNSKWIGSVAEVSDAQGRVVFKSEIRNQQFEISFNAAKAVYMLRIFSKRKALNLKLTNL